MTEIEKRIEGAVAHIREHSDFVPDMAMVLGSGLGGFAAQLEDAVSFPFGEIPGFPVATAPGHPGRLVLGCHEGRRVAALVGRVHCYEGYSMAETAIPVQVVRRLGAHTLFLANAAGGINLSYSQGALMVIKDHINIIGANPLFGPNSDSLGERFPDMTDLYTKELRAGLVEKAAAAGIRLEEGVYIMFSGPSFETPAEINAARVLGADAVGMSTIPEAIAARHAGMRVMGVSCITNMAAGVLDQPLTHAEVLETAERVKADFTRVVAMAIELGTQRPR